MIGRMSVDSTLILRGGRSRLGSLPKGVGGVNGSRSSRFPFFRGRRLLLEYKDGSRCENDNSRTTILSFLCDRDLEVTVLFSPSN
jgi:hypothetical protein